MANHVKNQITFNCKVFNMAILKAGSKGNIFDFNKIMPIPVELPEQLSSCQLLSFAHYLIGLNLNISELENLLLPVESHIQVKNIMDLNNGYNVLLNTWYSKTGKLKDELLANKYPLTVDELNSLGKSVYDNLIKYKHITSYDWCGEYWNTKGLAENTELHGYELEFYTRWSSPLPVVQKWAKDHKLSFTYKVFEGGCNWWYVAEFVDGEMVSKRNSEKSDFRPLLKELFEYSDAEIEEHFITD